MIHYLHRLFIRRSLRDHDLVIGASDAFPPAVGVEGVEHAVHRVQVHVRVLGLRARRQEERRAGYPLARAAEIPEVRLRLHHHCKPLDVVRPVVGRVVVGIILDGLPPAADTGEEPPIEPTFTSLGGDGVHEEDELGEEQREAPPEEMGQVPQDGRRRPPERRREDDARGPLGRRGRGAALQEVEPALERQAGRRVAHEDHLAVTQRLASGEGVLVDLREYLHTKSALAGGTPK